MHVQLQASFQATEPLSAIHSFVKSCLLPNAPAWYLYTTPPKQVMQDLRPTLFQAGLAPAAIVYLGTSQTTETGHGAAEPPPFSPGAATNGHTTGSREQPSLLRPDVDALRGAAPVWNPRERPERATGQRALAAAEKGKGKGKAADAGISQRDGQTGGDKAKKGPKWLKLGAK